MIVNLITLSVIINTLIFFNNDKIASLLKLYDKPDNIRKIHKSNVPLTGGVIVLLNTFIVLIFLFIDNSYLEKIKVFNNIRDLIIFLFSILLFFLIGFFDDKYGISANKKFLTMIIFLIPIVIYSEGLLISQIRVSFLDSEYILSSYASIFWTILCFLLFINAMNMFDGINYQVGLFSIYLCTFFLINNYFTGLFILVIISLLNFLLLNRKNNAFLGDNGSYLLAFLFGYFFIKIYNQETHIQSDHIFLIMIIPGIDLIRLFVKRIFKGYHPFRPDRSHLHHILLRKHNLNTVTLIIQPLIIIPSLCGYYFGYTFLFLGIQILIYFSIILSYKKN
ncbi:undecaprenyl/decaprenyl-phosphate alpha-N-acetylglucosaminyl 1-phosphate transferase [Candidatus Pelagibacter sp.]|nr:undecaprenyl/decaprenyl-phosphate alpha-N-acetylglucosaminyl 1-phosphate transferase [Candidatus Pelagibacter sp.]